MHSLVPTHTRAVRPQWSCYPCLCDVFPDLQNDMVCLVSFGCAKLLVCKGRLATAPPVVHKVIRVSGNPACNIRNSSYRWKITKVQVVLTCSTPDIRFLGKDPEESGNHGTWWIISGLACVLHAAYICQSLLLLTAGGLWKCSTSLIAFTIPVLLTGWRMSECDTRECWSYVLRWQSPGVQSALFFPARMQKIIMHICWKEKTC